MQSLGRPAYTDKQYQTWLYHLAPLLQSGSTLYHALTQTNLIKYKSAIYRKSGRSDWFGKKIAIYQRYPDEIAKEIEVRIVMNIADKFEMGKSLSRSEFRFLKHFNTTHRSTLPFFTHKYEPKKYKLYSNYQDL